jgi:hypothetical protein
VRDICTIMSCHVMHLDKLLCMLEPRNPLNRHTASVLNTVGLTQPHLSRPCALPALHCPCMYICGPPPQMDEGDLTVPLISLGLMGNAGWRSKRLNPSGMRVVAKVRGGGTGATGSCLTAW